MGRRKGEEENGMKAFLLRFISCFSFMQQRSLLEIISQNPKQQQKQRPDKKHRSYFHLYKICVNVTVTVSVAVVVAVAVCLCSRFV